ncbi:alpha/beta hydrolase-fold protein [Opitutaceae bacterium]|nr:alpha/beta hydrolase-fold protein [Opitutaceae bacterium]
MKLSPFSRPYLAAGIALLLTLILPAHEPAEVLTGDFELSPDSLVQAGVPQGRLEGPFEFHSKIITDTVRRYWVFVPAQYDPAAAANLMVFQDGQRATNPKGALRVQNVLTNLIHDGSIPPTIGVFVTPGNKSKRYPDNLGMSNPNHRWQEYDVLTTDYARMLMEELLPHVGKSYNISDDPKRRVIGGTSSGAICAFTVAWNYPDEFSNVISFIGSFVSIGARPALNDEHGTLPNGGQDYPALIRREPIRPMKIFFQDGSNDLDNEWGDWFLANQQMVKALNYRNRVADERAEAGPRYIEKHVWTDGKHSDSHGGSMLPDALRWIWSE